MRLWAITIYLLFLFSICVACYLRPTADDFDRYIYEALVRSRYEPPDVTYPIVKHSAPRAEESTSLDSVIHLEALEPFYAVKPLYILTIEALPFIPGIETRINLIAAASLFGIGIIVLLWTRRPLLSALLISSTPIVYLGRVGSPDGLSTFVLILAIWLSFVRNRLFPALILLLASIWIRTDNAIFVILVLGYLLWERKISIQDATTLSSLAASSVFFVNHFSGNGGWAILFKHSFIESFPTNSALTVHQFFSVFPAGVEMLIPQIAVWVLLAAVGWQLTRHPLLFLVWAAVAIHFLIFPSGQARYITWAFILSGNIFISALPSPQ